MTPVDVIPCVCCGRDAELPAFFVSADEAICWHCIEQAKSRSAA